MTRSGAAPRRRRADAQRNVDALLEAARTVFDTSGVDAPAKEITDLAGVGVGTLYRHFPQRSDLVKAVVESGIDAVADAGPALAATFEPAEALTRWIDRFTELLATKRGLASALHSGDPAFAGLPGYFLERLGPALSALLDAAAAEGAIRGDIERRGPAVRRRPAVPARARTGARAQPADRRRAGRRPALRRRGWITGVGGLNRGGPRCWRTDAMSLRLSILDLAPIGPGQTARESFAASVELARAAERLGYRRVWYAEHHNMASIASSATSVLIGHVADHTNVDPARRGRGDAAQPLAADDRRAVRHARDAAPRPHRPGPGPGARRRPGHDAGAAP